MSPHHPFLNKLFSLLLLSGLLASLVLPSGVRAQPDSTSQATTPATQSNLVKLAQLSKPVVSYSLKNDTSPALRDIKISQAQYKEVNTKEIRVLPIPGRAGKALKGNQSPTRDPVRQDWQGDSLMPDPLFNFGGLSNDDNAEVVGFYLAPPDTIGAAGYDSSTGKKYYVQWVNLVFAIWDVTSTPEMILGPLPGNALWAGFGTICEAANHGDIIVLFDELSDRWFMSQFALFAEDGFHQCVAVSENADPTGAWYRYDFLASATKLNDYPKFGVWPDAYYMSANQFDGSTFGWAGQGVWAYERDQMLLGLPARQVYFDLYETDPMLGGMLPSDLDGAPPPAGTPNYYATFDDDAWGYSADRLQIWAFSVDWANPDNSTFSPLVNLSPAAFDSELCPAFRGECVEQPNGQKLESLSDRLMYRLQYRVFDGYQAMVVNHSVDADGEGTSGIRWYELRDDGAGWSIYQQGTFAPDGDSRWMGSIAMDRTGNIAVGYSVSSSQTHPSIRYVGRLIGDPLGTLPQFEVEMVDGMFSQDNVGRWGDYSQMALDPTDDCTFWYTQEYASSPNEVQWGNWTTQIASFKFPTCTTGPSGILHGYVTDADSNAPIANALIDLGSGITTFTANNGEYQILGLPVGTYDVTAVAYGYYPQTVTGLLINDDVTTHQDFALTSAPLVTVSGVVTDATHGWPLYARIDLSTFGHAESFFTDPVSGAYSLQLYESTEYVFKVAAIMPGYLGETRSVTPVAGGNLEDFGLRVDAGLCITPGYVPQYVFFEDFEADDGGFTSAGTNNSWEWGTPTSGPGNAYSGEKVWATNLAGNYNDDEDSQVTSPAIDLSGYANQTPILTWWQWLKTEGWYDYARVEVSNDGGASWSTVFGPLDGDIDDEWTKYTIILDSSYAVSNFQVRFALETDYSVTFPGFYIDDVAIGFPEPPPTYYTENFESDNGSFNESGINSSWEWGVPTRGPGSAHSGENAWATNLGGDYNNDEDSLLTSPAIDLSSVARDEIELTWWQWMQTESGYDFVSLEASKDGGANWEVLFGPWSGPVDTQWNAYGVTLDPSYFVNNFVFRFSFTSDSTVTYPGIYVDDVAIHDHPYQPPRPPCVTIPGGLVVGNVSDANTSSALNQASVTSDTGESATTFATPADPGVEDGLYMLFTTPGNHLLTAAKSGGYGAQEINVGVVADNTFEQDFQLPAGWLVTDPTQLDATLAWGASTTLTLTLTNQGDIPVEFEVKERPKGFVPASHSGAPLRPIRGKFTPYRVITGTKSNGDAQNPASIQGGGSPWMDIADYPVYIMDNTADVLDGKVYSVGGYDGSSLLNSGYVYDPDSNSWASIASMSVIREKPAAAFVDDQLYVVGGWGETGEPSPILEIYDPASDTWHTGASIPAAYAAATAVSLDDQLYVIGGCAAWYCGVTDVFRYDPAGDSWSSLAPYPEVTSWLACGVIDNQIYCAGGVSDYGESAHTYVYDPAADTWSQLADMPQTQWGMGYVAANNLLYVSGGVTDNFSTITNETFFYDPTSDTWTTDANSNYTVYRGGSACGFYKIGGSIGGFSPIPKAEVYPGLSDCGVALDVPWLSSDITEGIIPGGRQSVDLSITLDASVAEVNQPGEYTAEIRLKENTPYSVPAIPVTMNVTPPAGWGKVTGTITGLARCDAPGAPLAKATIDIGGVATTSTNNAGVYVYWIGQGDYTLTISTPGYVTKTVPVTITDGGTTTLNADLRLDAPCADPSPTSFNIAVMEGEITTATLTISNLGAGSLLYSLLESAFDLAYGQPAEEAGQPGGINLSAKRGPASILSLADQAGNEPLPPIPNSGWYAGLPLPGGIVRYAHAQCEEQPNIFYVISGVNGNFSISRKAWRYDSTLNVWTELASIPIGTEGPSAVCYQGKIYTLGGSSSNLFYIYDIANNTWSDGPALPRYTAGAAAGAWDGKIYLIGGDDDFYPASGVSDQVNIFNLETGEWEDVGTAMPEGLVFSGFVQAGPYLYIAGGWKAASPAENSKATLRYDMATDSWVIGPEFNSARADFALALTEQALYAIGGDADGGSYFDADDLIERLSLANWPEGDWVDLADPLPRSLSANNAGFCGDVFSGTAVWSVGGANLFQFGIIGDNFFKIMEAENCYSIYTDVPWLVSPTGENTVPSDSSYEVTLTFDSTGLAPGIYQATLLLITSDKGKALVYIPITFYVGEFTILYFPIVGR